MTRQCAQRGFTILESLVALLLFAFGILGLIGMQATAARVAADAQYRAEATMWADKLISQMRTDNPASLSADYSEGGGKYAAWLVEVQDAAAGGLPGAMANPPTVEIAGTPPVVTVTIFWTGPGETVPHRYVTVATMN
ncbi:hypothetical protein MASR1M60_06140 [Rhodocyclaceae bacterium]